MKALQNGITTILLVIGMSTTQGVAKESQGNKEQTAQTETQTLDKKIAVIQTQIDELEAKGFRNLSRKEKLKYVKLLDQLLTAQKEKTAEAKRKTAEQEKIIAEEKRKTQQAYDSVNQKLKSIGESLSSK